MHLSQFLELDEPIIMNLLYTVKSEREKQISYINAHIWKRCQEHTEELYKKDLHNLDNHDGVIIYLESDILGCKVKWALGNNSTNKDSGGDGIPAELFKS